MEKDILFHIVKSHEKIGFRTKTEGFIYSPSELTDNQSINGL